MSIWQTAWRGLSVTLTGLTLALGQSGISAPATAQETIACVSNGLGVARIVEDGSQCRFWEHARIIGGGDGAGIGFVFVTSGLYDGDLVTAANNLVPAPPGAPFGETQGLDAGDAICNHHAAAVFLPGTYLAWLSTGNADVADRFQGAGADGPWFNVKGELVAASRAGLLVEKNGNYLYNAVLYTEGGEAAQSPNDLAWTGTNENGTVSSDGTPNTCGDWAETEDIGLVGRVSELNSNWTSATFPSCADDTKRIYCFMVQNGVVE